MESVEVSKIMPKGLEDQKCGQYSRESICNIRDEMDSVSLRFSGEEYICEIGVARPTEERVNNFLLRHGADDGVVHARAVETEQGNSDKGADKKLIMDRVKYILARIHEHPEELTVAFLELNVPQSPYLYQIIGVIYHQAIRWPEYCTFYAALCHKQITEELSTTINVSIFRNCLLIGAQHVYAKSEKDAIADKKRELNYETDPEKREAKMDALIKAVGNTRKEKFGTTLFLGHLFLQGDIISIRIIQFVVKDLLTSVTMNKLHNCEADEDSIKVAVEVMTLVGKKAQEDEDIAALRARRAALIATKIISRNPLPQKVVLPQAPVSIFPIIFETLEVARSIVSIRLMKKIDRLISLRANGWVARA